MTEHKTLAAALCAAQAAMPTLVKDGTNPHFKSKFTPLDTIVETVGPIIAEHGLTWSTFPCYGPNGEPALRYKLTHVSGEFEEGIMPLLVTKADPQGMGSAITYARRYSITAVLNLVADEDDDGNNASRAPAQKQQQRPANGGEVKLATKEDVVAMELAAKSLDVADIKLALGACGLTSVTAFRMVPASKVVEVTKTLAKAAS